MSSAILLDATAFTFMPSSGGQQTEAQPQEAKVDTQKLEQVIEARVRRQLEAEFQQKLELEVTTRVSAEHMRFEKMMAQCQAGVDQVIYDLKNEIQHNVVDLSIRLAEVIIRHKLPDGEMIRDLIVKTLEPVSDLQGALVRISSTDMQLFGETVIKSGERGVGNTVEFAEDPNLQQGDVIVESRNGIFDARLSERLKILKETLSKRTGSPALAQDDAESPETPEAPQTSTDSP